MTMRMLQCNTAWRNRHPVCNQLFASSPRWLSLGLHNMPGCPKAFFRMSPVPWSQTSCLCNCYHAQVATRGPKASNRVLFSKQSGPACLGGLYRKDDVLMRRGTNFPSNFRMKTAVAEVLRVTMAAFPRVMVVIKVIKSACIRRMHAPDEACCCSG